MVKIEFLWRIKNNHRKLKTQSVLVGQLSQTRPPQTIFLHTGSMTVSQHARKESTSGGAQFDSFSLSQGPTTTRVARMESEFNAKLQVEGARCLKKSATLCQEGPLSGRRI